METLEEIKQRVQREKQMADRLDLATTRLEDAQQERVWALAAAQATGLSIRKIAAATGLSPSRIHQLLNNQEAGVCVAVALKATLSCPVSWTRTIVCR